MIQDVIDLLVPRMEMVKRKGSGGGGWLMGSFNIESGENALTPMFNLGDEHRAILLPGPRKREREREKTAKRRKIRRSD